MTTQQTPVLPREAFGFLYMTAGFEDAFGPEALLIGARLFGAFASNDWGTTPPEDAQLNHETILEGSGRVMGSYDVDGTKVWIISYIQANPAKWGDKNTCNTCVLLPSEY